MKERKRGT